MREGRDFQCAFYGGALLAQTQFTSPEAANDQLVNLFRVNPNIVVICDSDRSSGRAALKPRTRRIREEVKRVPGAHIWITGTREIENYIPGTVLGDVFGGLSVPNPGKYDHFFPVKSSRQESYVEQKLKRRHVDKMELASLTASRMTVDLMESRFDWKKQMARIVDRIASWNS